MLNVALRGAAARCRAPSLLTEPHAQALELRPARVADRLETRQSSDENRPSVTRRSSGSDGITFAAEPNG
jgi:hypothetical protein